MLAPPRQRLTRSGTSMPADKYGVGPDKDCYPGSDVLVNLLGIEDGAVLAEAEVAFTQQRLVPLLICLNKL